MVTARTGFQNLKCISNKLTKEAEVSPEIFWISMDFQGLWIWKLGSLRLDWEAKFACPPHAHVTHGPSYGGSESFLERPGPNKFPGSTFLGTPTQERWPPPYERDGLQPTSLRAFLECLGQITGFQARRSPRPKAVYAMFSHAPVYMRTIRKSPRPPRCAAKLSLRARERGSHDRIDGVEQGFFNPPSN